MNRSKAISFGLIVTVAFLLRFISLNQQGYWYDEILTLKNSRLPWPQMLVALQETETNKPPLYYLFMQQWLKGGDSETWTRLPSAIFGALTCGIFFLIGCRVLDTRTAWIMAAFLSLSPFHLGYSDEMRMYALLGLEASAALLCLILFFQEKKIGYLIVFGFLSVLANYTFSYGFFLLGLCGLLLLVQWKKLGPMRSISLLVTLIISFALFVPWLIRMVQVSNLPEGAQFYKGPPWSAIIYTFYSFGFGFDLGPSTNDLQTMGAKYFSLHPAQTVLTLVALMVIVVISGRGLWALRKDLFLFTFGFGGLCIFLLGPAVISLLKPTVTYNPRYAFLALIPFGLIMAVGVRALWRDGLFLRWIAVLYGLFLSLALYHFYFSPEYGREDLRAASRFVEQLDAKPKVIVVSAHYLGEVVARYYHGSAPILGFSVLNPATFDTDVRNFRDQLDGSGRFAVICARLDHGDRQHQLLPWLQSRYHLLEQKELPGTEVYLFSVQPAATASP